MPHKHAAIKYLRITKKRTDHNTAVKRNIAYLRKTVLKAVTAKDKPKALELYAKLVSAVDKAARRNILKMNTAARRKSRVIAKINAMK